MIKNVQMTCDEKLLAEIDQEVAKTGTNRSKFLRDAAREILHRRRIAELARKEIEAYRRQPITQEERRENAEWDAEADIVWYTESDEDWAKWSSGAK